MKISIIGDGTFGSFLKDLLNPIFEITEDAESVILAVPFSAYDEVGKENKHRHLINVCSIQKPSTDILLKYTDRVTSIHPLFGKRTPANKRNSLWTHRIKIPDDIWYEDCVENEFLDKFSQVSKIAKYFSPEQHDIMMSKTHLAAVIVGEQAKIFIERAQGIPDEFIPHSFRLLREFVKTMEDMPKGTVDSIKANIY